MALPFFGALIDMVSRLPDPRERIRRCALPPLLGKGLSLCRFCPLAEQYMAKGDTLFYGAPFFTADRASLYVEQNLVV